jgi:thiosulfate/3-mercaptopyruvate sulfurtransferase
VDVRWRLADPEAGARAFAAGHLPGAVFLDVDRDLAAPPGRGPGRHPLPDTATFTQTLERIGVGDQSRVVAYDDAGGAVAARLWFLLRYFGHDGGAVLDGGIQAWQAAGLPLTADPPPPLPSPPPRFHARPRPQLAVDRRELTTRLARGALLLDARQAERFRGETEPVDPRAGHIPGARSAPFADNLAAAAGPFRTPAALRERYQRLGASDQRDILCYCGSGVTACHDLLALTLAGFETAVLYEGSWSDWCGDLAAEVATGEGP